MLLSPHDAKIADLNQSSALINVMRGGIIGSRRRLQYGGALENMGWRNETKEPVQAMKQPQDPSITRREDINLSITHYP